MISNIAITEKNEKLYQTISIPQIFDGFTDKPVVQCDVQVEGNTFMDDSN